MKSYYMAMPWIAQPVNDIIAGTIKMLGKSVKLKKNTTILHQNRIFDKFIYVESGLLGQVTNDTSLKKPSLMGLIPPGRMIGPTPVAIKSKNIANFYAMRESSVYIARLDDLLQYTLDNPKVKDEFFIATISRMHTHMEKFAVAAMMMPKERLQLFFKVILTAYNVNCDATWLRIPVNLSIIEFSNIVYSTEQMITKFFTQWKKEGLLKRENRYTIIHRDLIRDFDWKKEEVAFYDI